MYEFSNLFVIVRVADDQKSVVCKDIAGKSLNRSLLLLILKNSKFQRKKPLLKSIFSMGLQA